MENAKIEKLKCDIFGDFQTLWRGPSLQFSPRGDPKTSHDRTSGPVLHLYEASVGCQRKAQHQKCGVATSAFFFLYMATIVVKSDVNIHRFTDKRCELKLFGIPYLRGLNDIITEDTDFRRTYVDDKSMYTSGNS